jgi:transketolase
MSSEAYLADALLSSGLPRQSNREGFGRGLLEAGKSDDQIVALCADVTASTKVTLFAEAFPDRFFNVGIAEQNLVSVASGLAAVGKIPFASSFAIFNPGRNWEQIRTTICINDQNVKIVGSHAGISVGPDGATHQMLEDIALMRVLPNMMVVVPADALEAEKATMALALHRGPAYLRLSRDETPLFTTDKTPFSLTKALILRRGTDLTLVSTGTMTYEAIIAAEKLAVGGISAELLHVPVIKPLDNVSILRSIEKTGVAITIEEGQAAGGLGGAISELSTEYCPIRMKRIGVQDRFGQSGDPQEQMAAYDQTAKDIVAAGIELLESLGRKNPKGVA